MDGRDVRTNIGVFVASTSIIAWAPVVYTKNETEAVPVAKIDIT